MEKYCHQNSEFPVIVWCLLTPSQPSTHTWKRIYSFSWLCAECVGCAPPDASKITLPWPLRGHGGRGKALELKLQGCVLVLYQRGPKGRGYASLIFFTVLKFSVDSIPRLPVPCLQVPLPPTLEATALLESWGSGFLIWKFENNAPCGHRSHVKG